MVDYAQITGFMHFGRGKEAEVLGPPWLVYRIGENSEGQFLDDFNLVLKNVPAYYKVNTPKLKQSIDFEKIPGVILYELAIDITQFQLKVGDVLICSDPIMQVGHTQVTYETNQINAFLLAQDKAAGLTVGVRLNQLVKVLRPSSGPSPNDAWEPTSDNSNPVILDSGLFSLNYVGADPCYIPMGLFPVVRPYGEKAFNEAPGMPKKSGWAAYAPPMPGFNFRQGDRVIAKDRAIYQVVIAAAQETGLVGTYLFLERESEGTCTPTERAE